VHARRVFLRVSSRDEDIEGSEGTGTSGSSDTVGENLVTGLLEVAVGENETDVACEMSMPVTKSSTDAATHP
jgi:hypothetical protein